MGSNVKTYKHKYYVAYFPLSQANAIKPGQCRSLSPKFQKTEVSKMAWFSFEECMQHIRPYNLEKIKILRNLNDALKEYEILC